MGSGYNDKAGTAACVRPCLWHIQGAVLGRGLSELNIRDQLEEAEQTAV